MANQPLQGSALVLLTVSLSLATFMQVLDVTITNVSIPTIAGDLGVSPNQGTWVITSFAVSNAIALPLTGWLAKRFGEVKLFVAATQLFTLAVIATVALSFFIVWELTERHPVVDLSLFAQRNFTVGAIAVSLGYMGFFGNVVIFPLWLQTQMGYTATWAGLAAAPIGILSLVFTPLVGRNLHKVDLRLLASFSFLVFAAVSFWSAGFNTNVSYWQLAVPRLVLGIGLATFFVPLTSLLLSGLAANWVASASGLANFLRYLAGSFGTSLSITLWDRREAVHHTRLSEQISAFNPLSHQALERLHELGFNGAAGFSQLARTITNQAYMLATNDFFWLLGWLFLGLLLLVWLARPPFSSAAGGAELH